MTSLPRAILRPRTLRIGVLAAVAALCVGGAGWLVVAHVDAHPTAALQRGAIVTLRPLAWAGLAAGALIGGSVLALAYAFAFEAVARHAAAWLGAAAGAVHACLAWLGVGLLPWLFPAAGDALAYEMDVLSNSAGAIALLLLVHVTYGAVIGALYGPTVHEQAPVSRVTCRA